MKFDVVIGNPPYQEEKVNDNNQAPPLYNLFMDESRKISDKVLLITPARFLSDAGATPKRWNKAMLNDKHFKIVYFEPKSQNVFPNTDIKGGIVVTLYDKLEDFGEIDTFIPMKPLESIFKKVRGSLSHNLSSWIFSPDSYRLTDKMFEENPELINRTDISHRKAISSNVFERYPEVFDDEVGNVDFFVSIYGRVDGVRMYKFIKREYVREHSNLDKWKVLIPGANGTGTFGEALSSPVVGEPGVAHTQTFVSIGTLDTQFEGQSLLKYVKSKFLRALLGIMKTTHNNQGKRTWSKIPLQDFTPNSDIDWTTSIAEIDQQLYEKYGLSEEEITFIETNVKEMA